MTEPFPSARFGKMRLHPARHVARAVLGALLLLSLVPASPVPASAAGYPRRIAIAPFASLTKEDIGATVSVLPRLLASRLMALAGADVVLLPADGKAPGTAAKEAKFPLLLQGTVAHGRVERLTGSRFFLFVRRPARLRVQLAGKVVALPAHRNLRVVITPDRTTRVRG